MRRDFIIFLPAMMWLGTALAQPDLTRWSTLASALEESTWVADLERLEPGCILSAAQPDLSLDGVRPLSPWADALVAELEALPLAEHHADRALQRLLEQGMRRFQLVQAAADRDRPGMEAALERQGLPREWAVVPMVLTGWDRSYYGPGRRAGAWAMDLPTGLSLGLTIRRGWDERHVPERMADAACAHIQRAQSWFPDSPVRQVLAFVRGKSAGDTHDPDALDADLLGWLHLLRVMVQVDRNFKRDRLHALWALREKEWTSFQCDEAGPLYFSHHRSTDWTLKALKQENPWFTTDSIGVTDVRPSIRVRSSWIEKAPDSGLTWCSAERPEPQSLEWTYTVRPGDVLGTIARRTGVRIEELRRWNGLDGDLIRVGQTLILRGGTPPDPTDMRSAKAPSSPMDPDARTDWVWYTVETGDSYWSIASATPGVGLADLLDLNDIAPESLRPGMRIRIPVR